MHADGSLHEEGAIKMMEPLKADDPDLYDKFMVIGRQCAEEGNCNTIIFFTFNHDQFSKVNFNR